MSGLTPRIDAILALLRPAFNQQRSWNRMHDLAYALLTCLGRHTITGLLCNTGQQFVDWSANYRLFGHKRFDVGTVWQTVLAQAARLMPHNVPLFAVLDDTIVRKRGKKVYGAGWRRDPLGPRFQTNLVWAQRVVQASAILPTDAVAAIPNTDPGPVPGPGRAIPVGLVALPKPDKPRQDATPEQVQAYKAECAAASTALLGSQCIARVRRALTDTPGNQTRALVFAVDGGYTNRTVFRSIPANTTLIGRLRADAHLNALPAPAAQAAPTGRPRLYGETLPTPEAVRQDEQVRWLPANVYAAGRLHQFQVKTLSPVRWKPAGAKDCRLVVIRPLAYRRTKQAKVHYRQAAYLICTDPQLPIDQLVQAYVWRWEAEVGFRDQKTLLGLGEAQVRTQSSVQSVCAFVAATYAILHLAAAQAGITDTGLPLPRWRNSAPPKRLSTAQLINRLRAELWAHALRLPLDGFDAAVGRLRSHQNPTTTLASAVCYAQN